MSVDSSESITISNGIMIDSPTMEFQTSTSPNTHGTIVENKSYIALQHPASGRYLGYWDGKLRFLESKLGDGCPPIAIFQVFTEYAHMWRSCLVKPNLSKIDTTDMDFQAVCFNHLGTNKFLSHGWSRTMQLDSEPQWFYIVASANDHSSIKLFSFPGKLKQCSWINYEGGNLFLGKPYGLLQPLQSPSAIYRRGIEDAVQFKLIVVHQEKNMMNESTFQPASISPLSGTRYPIGEFSLFSAYNSNPLISNGSISSSNKCLLTLNSSTSRSNEFLIVDEIVDENNIRIVVYENQRWSKQKQAYVATSKEKDGIFSFSSDPHGLVMYIEDSSPSQSKTGIPDLDSCDISYAIKNGWKWKQNSIWKCVAKNTIDADGWCYGNSFTSLYHSTAKRRTHHSKCRQRSWFRDVIPPSTYDNECQTARKEMTAVGKNKSISCIGKVYMHKVGHLIVLIHGIGRHDDDKMRKKQRELRATIQTLYQKFRHESLFESHHGHTEIEYVQWHDELHDDEGLDHTMTSLSLDSVPALRRMFRETILDAVSYMGTYASAIQDVVVKSLNAKIAAFKACHPNFNGNVSLLGHSLGSTISFDILTSCPERLKFHPNALFAVGSPIGLFLAIRRISPEMIREMFKNLRNRGIRFYNIFHPVDPVANKIEPLIYGGKDPPCVIQHYSFKSQLLKSTDYNDYNDTVNRHRIDYQVVQQFSLGDATNYFAVMNAHRSYWSNKHVLKFILEHILSWSGSSDTGNSMPPIQEPESLNHCQCIFCHQKIKSSSKYCFQCGAKQSNEVTALS